MPGLPPRFTDGRLLLCPHLAERCTGVLWGPLYEGTNPIRAPPSDLIASFRLHLLTPPPSGLRLPTPVSKCLDEKTPSSLKSQQAHSGLELPEPKSGSRFFSSPAGRGPPAHTVCIVCFRISNRSICGFSVRAFGASPRTAERCFSYFLPTKRPYPQSVDGLSQRLMPVSLLESRKCMYCIK